jgi:hypothetical protein
VTNSTKKNFSFPGLNCWQFVHFTFFSFSIVYNFWPLENQFPAISMINNAISVLRLSCIFGRLFLSIFIHHSNILIILNNFCYFSGYYKCKIFMIFCKNNYCKLVSKLTTFNILKEPGWKTSSYRSLETGLNQSCWLLYEIFEIASILASLTILHSNF